MEIDVRLAQVAPKWFNRIRRARTVSGLMAKKEVQLGPVTKILDITEFESCMVGETYLFTNGYNPSGLASHKNECKRCTSISQRVTYGPKHPWLKTSTKYFQRVIKEFCDHLEKDHGVYFGN